MVNGERSMANSMCRIEGAPLPFDVVDNYSITVGHPSLATGQYRGQEYQEYLEARWLPFFKGFFFVRYGSCLRSSDFFGLTSFGWLALTLRFGTAVGFRTKVRF